MRVTSFIGLLLVTAVAFSLAALPGPLASHFALPAVPLAHALPAPVENWFPGGPAMDTLVEHIFADESAEFIGLQGNVIDLTDWPLPPPVISSLIADSNFYVTAPISATEYFELEFHLGTNFWGCGMSFGNSACGVDIRQGIAHLVDKTVFTNNQPSIAGLSIPIDNPVPPSVGLPPPNPCTWDSSHPEAGTSCKVGAPGGTAYHLATAVPCNVSGGCASTPTFSWTPGLGAPDFCAAADHFIAAGLASGKNLNTCVLTGIATGAASNGVNFFVRVDNPPRLDLGNSVAQGVCALFTGSFTTGCSPYVTTTPGPVTAFPGFTTSPTTVEQDWNVYTAGFINVLTFDSGLYFGYNSRFVSGIPSIQPPGGPCSPDAVPSFSPSNYMYLCSPSYDIKSSQMEFAPCLTAPGDPTPGQTTPTFANCPGTSQPTAVSAGYQSENLFGQNAFTIPIWSGKNQFGYRSNWQRVVNHAGNGLLNFYATLNAYSANPSQPGTIRQGFKQTTHSLNPYIASTFWDFGVIGNIWDSLRSVNPTANSQQFDWMTIDTKALTNSQLTYTPPTGTVATFRFTLRSDIRWHDTKPLTAWDVAFSYLTLKATGSFQGSGLAPMTGVKVISPTQIDVNVNGVGPFTLLALTAPTVFPGRYWSTCPGAIWDADVAVRNVPDRCMVADSTKIVPTFDPLATGILVGSGPWVCRSSSGVAGGGCSSSGAQNPPVDGSYTLTRYGLGSAPAGTLQAYFRSSGNLAAYLWSGNTGDPVKDFLNFAALALCYSQPLQPLGSTSGCGHWQQGIGAPGGYAQVLLTQVGIVQRYVGVNWVAPYVWTASPPAGLAALPPVLYEGTATLRPATIAGCTSPYPAGGYDC